MSVKLTPSKRPYDQNIAETNGKGKWQKLGAFSSHDSPSPVNNTIRVLCPVSRISNVIGEDGNVIAQICQETGAVVRVEETVPGCDYRVIIIYSSETENEVGSEQGNLEGGETVETNKADKGANPDELEKNDADKQSALAERQQKDNSSIQKALMVVFERLVEGEPEMDGGEDADSKSSPHIITLIVYSSQVGCLFGKGGSTINQVSSESGAEIRTLSRDNMPLCVFSSDELVQISGAVDAVRKSLQSVSQLLLSYSHDQETTSMDSDGPSYEDFGHAFSQQDSLPESNRSFRGQGLSFSAGHRDGEMGFSGRVKPSQDVLTFRLLCPDEKVGGVIGKGGNIIKALQHETGCGIKVLEGIAGSEDRLIVVSGQVHPDERISAVQDAVLRVQSRIFRAAPESKEKNVTAKILVSSNQIGCLLGKGGSIIAEMRKSTGAYIRILGKEQVPKCAAENEEVVQVNGELEAVQEALMQITARLRSHFFRDAFPSMNHGSNPAFLDQMPPFPSYVGRREFSPPGMYNIGPPFQKFDAVGGRHRHADRPPYMHDVHRPGIPPHLSESMPSSAPWGPHQGMIEGGGYMGLPEYPGAPKRRIGGFGGGNHPAIITSTTVEVVVPCSVVPAIYGEDGGCLRQIREISDAKIAVTDSKPGATETLITISGTPEQTNAAQSLIQAFVISEKEAS